MASPLTTRLPEVIAGAGPGAPRSILFRHLVRAAACVPYLGLVAWLSVAGGAGVSLGAGVPGRGLSPGALWVSRLSSGNAVWLAVIGAVCVGGVVGLCRDRLAQERVPVWLMVALLAGVGASPPVWGTALFDLEGALGLAFFTLAMAGAVDFAVVGRTTSGYVAGFAMAFGVLSDPGLLGVGMGILALAMVLSYERVGQRWVIRSTGAILRFPTAGMLGGWAFLDWRFSGSARAMWVTFAGSAHLPAGALVAWMGQVLVCSPLFVVAAAIACVHHPRRLVGYLVGLVGLGVAGWLGSVGVAEGIAFCGVFGVLGLAGIGRATWERALLVVAAVGQIAIPALLGIGAGSGLVRALGF